MTGPEIRLARESSGLTLSELSLASGYSIATINGLELRDQGSARLRQKLTEILTGTPVRVPLANTLNLKKFTAEMEIELAARRAKTARYDANFASWRARAERAEAELERLKRQLREMGLSIARKKPRPGKPPAAAP